MARDAYPPPYHRETRREELIGFMREVGFGHLVTAPEGPGGGAPSATGVPFIVKVDGETVTLEAHLQIGNPQWRALGGEVMALFQGPHAYVRPPWYETWRKDGRAVPTWDYITVQVRGPAEAIQDRAWLARHVGELTGLHESGRPDAWSLADTPTDYVESLLGGIVGVRLAARELDGRWKLNQNHPKANRLGVIAGLTASGRPDDAGVAAAMMRREAERADD